MAWVPKSESLPLPEGEEEKRMEKKRKKNVKKNSDHQ